METLEIDMDVSNNATTFDLKGDHRSVGNFPTLKEAWEQANQKLKSRRTAFRGMSPGLQSTFFIYREGEFVEYTPVHKEIELDYDFTIPLKPKKTYTVKARIKSVVKHSPRIFFD